MRKLVSVLVIAVMVLSLAVPTFAAPNSPDSPNADPSENVTEIVPTVGDAVDATTGEKIDVVVSEPELKEGETLKSITEDAMKAAEDAGIDVSNANASGVFNIELPDGGELGGPVNVTLVQTLEGDVKGVLAQNADGSWDPMPFEQRADGSVVITFSHFCTVVLLVDQPTQAPDVKPTPKPDGGSTGGSGSSGSSEPTSPQTGYDCA